MEEWQQNNVHQLSVVTGDEGRLVHVSMSLGGIKNADHFVY